MSNILLPDDIDFAAYLHATDANHKVVSGHSFAADVERLIECPDRITGDCMPWKSTYPRFRFRQSEVTVWTGYNGHGKSYALGMVCASLVSQRSKVCIASFEMPARRTLYRLIRQAAGRDTLDAEFARGYLANVKEHLWLYDHLGQTTPEKLLAVIRYCSDKKGIKHFVIDSLLTCGLPEDGNGALTAQKQFIGDLCVIARDTGIHIHLVAHARVHDLSVLDLEKNAAGRMAVTRIELSPEDFGKPLMLAPKIAQGIVSLPWLADTRRDS